MQGNVAFLMKDLVLFAVSLYLLKQEVERVIGGGYIGLELSQAMRRFGSQVTIIDRNDRLMHQEDHDVTEGLRSLFEDEYIDIVLHARVKGVFGPVRKVSKDSEPATFDQPLGGDHKLKKQRDRE
jgi:pyruvate/2-oxoglutarate dehydrogenase complex dihydrolipoamide dehydrogenase (E3) component